MKMPLFICLMLALLPAGAFAKTAPLPVGKHDRHAPIEVTSDTLQVFQQQNRAIFSGHVVAIQENVRLKADKMTVYYRKPADKAGKEKAPEDGGKDAIQKIEAEGGVFLSTPQETASGDNGVYDVMHQEIHLTGHVVLTREKNVLKGEDLTYNFTTGQSVLHGGTTSAASATAGKSTGRVRALFVPDSGANKKTK